MNSTVEKTNVAAVLQQIIIKQVPFLVAVPHVSKWAVKVMQNAELSYFYMTMFF